MRISDWSSDVCSSDLLNVGCAVRLQWDGQTHTINKDTWDLVKGLGGKHVTIVFKGKDRVSRPRKAKTTACLRTLGTPLSCDPGTVARIGNGNAFGRGFLNERQLAAPRTGASFA